MQIQGPWFTDETNRRVLMRGVNLGGNCKIPAGCPPSEIATRRQKITFVGRPFPLDEADEHYRRLKSVGFNCLRFLTTWEAIEHAGPGIYDEAYLDYLYAVVRKAGEYGFWVFLDPHQDAWSRFSGGCGSPAWTLDLLGFDLENLDLSEAAITSARLTRGAEYPPMVWPNNWGRLACCTMFTLFFAGERFAPQTKINGESAQEFLQRHFIAALQQAAMRLADLPHVIGYDSMNEPLPGYIGLESLSAPLPVYNSAPQLTGFESLYIPAGFACQAPFMERRGLEQTVTRQVTLNPSGACAWKNASADVWRQHGVWDVDQRRQPVLLRDDYFSGVDFFRECLTPFLRRYAAAMRAVHPEAIMFVEGEPGGDWDSLPEDLHPVVNASHWYDLLTLVTKHFDPSRALVWGSGAGVEGTEAVRASFAAQIGALVRQSRTGLKGAPTLIGEFGVPFDLDDGACLKTGNYEPQIQALDMYYDALDANLAHATLWNYTADNNHQDGDGWNQEDLSIFSIQDGLRAVEGFCRPRVVAAAGIPIRQAFEQSSGCFELEVDVLASITAPTTVFVPSVHYHRGVKIAVTDGEVEYNRETQILVWKNASPGLQTLTISRNIEENVI